jgi:Putative Ig domain
MAVITPPNNIAPLTDDARLAKHQVIGSPAAITFRPSHYNPMPVASALRGGTTGAAYSETITAQGGTAPYTFAVTSGALPTGTTMSSGGVISGTPSATGSFSFTVTVTDSLGYTGSQAFTIAIAAPSSGGGGYSYTFIS